jgi:hypothetical protein
MKEAAKQMMWTRLRWFLLGVSVGYFIFMG